MIELVVNADDLGLDSQIDEGILRAHREGIVTSASVLVTGLNAAEAVRQAKAQGLSMGVHLALTSHLAPAAPPGRVSSVAPTGWLRPSWKEAVRDWTLGRLRGDEVEFELRAQLERAEALGFEPDHLDTHQHLHLLPGVRDVVLALAAERRLPLRWPRESPHWGWLRHPGPALKSLVLSGLGLRREAHLHPVMKVSGIGIFEAGGLTEHRLASLLATLPPGVSELGCHPGARSETMETEPDWRYSWTGELAALTSPRIKNVIAARQIKLISYRDLHVRQLRYPEASPASSE